MLNKRGQGLSINTIILIVLGILVLVILAVGFTMGWSNIKDWLTGGDDNVDKIVFDCKQASELENAYAYCSQKRMLDDGTDKLNDVTCYFLSKEKTQYGVVEDETLCSGIVTLKACVATTDAGKTSQLMNTAGDTLEHKACP